jgi:hypothetical protein
VLETVLLHSGHSISAIGFWEIVSYWV